MSDDARIRAVVTNLKNLGLHLNDLEKEITLRNKWGKRQNPSMVDFTTEELVASAQVWLRF